jgi:CheY-like chemotaxis protein
MAKVLYVEDYQLHRDMLAEMLALGGFEVDVAADGLEGVAKAQAWRPDVILTDLQMPRMNGFQAIKKLRSLEETAKIPIISLSAKIGELYKQQALAAGANEHLTKPVNPAQLILTINAYLSKD